MNEEGFGLVTRPSIVQQYYNHDANFFKVYVIGNDVMVFQRPSLPNLNHEQASGSSTTHRTCINASALQSVAFDSRFAYPTLAEFLINSTHDSDLFVCNSLSRIEDDVDYLVRKDSFGSAVCDGNQSGSDGSSSNSNRIRKRKPTANDLSTLSPGHVRRVQPPLTTIPDLVISPVATASITNPQQANIHNSLDSTSSIRQQDTMADNECTAITSDIPIGMFFSIYL